MRWIAIFFVAILVVSCARAADNWPQFRGPACDGHADASRPPVEWSETKNVRWKTAVHDRGHSSPVVWGQQVWLTTAKEDGKQLYVVGVDCRDGKVLHDVKLFDVEKPEPAHDLNSYASPTPAVEAGRLYVHFGCYGTACLDTTSGKTLWSRRDLECNHFRGPGSSVFLYQDLVILTFDGFDVQYLVALDKTTGATRWKTARTTDFGQIDGDLRKAYATPLAITVGGRVQLVSPGAYAAMAYDPANGKELWKVDYPGGYSNVARPVFGQGLVFLSTGFGRTELWAVRPDGHGDVTKSHVAWKLTKGVPMKPSPVVVDKLLFMVNDGGIASCVEAATGTVLWQERLGGQFSASVLASGDRVYFFDQSGKTTVVAADRKFKVLSVNRLDGGCMATPAVVGGAMYLRTLDHLYRIE